MNGGRTARRPIARLARILLEHLRETKPDAFQDIVDQINSTGFGSVDLPGYSVSMSTTIQRGGEVTAVLSAAGTAWHGFGFGERSPIINDRGDAVVVVLPSTMRLPASFRASLLDVERRGTLLGDVYATGLEALDSLRVHRVSESGGDLLLHNDKEPERAEYPRSTPAEYLRSTSLNRGR